MCLGSTQAQEQQAAQPTAEEFRAASIEWDSGRLMEAYRTRHADAPKDGVKRVDSFVHHVLAFAQWQEGAPTLADLKGEESDLQSKKLADSMVHALAGYAMAQRSEPAIQAEGGKRLDQFVAQMEKDGYPADFIASLSFMRARCALRQPDGLTKASGILVGAVQGLAHTIRDRDWTLTEQRYLHWRISWSISDRCMLRASGQALQGLLQEAGPTGKNPWLSEMIMGEWEITEAWMDRGNGSAKDVTKEGWEGFARHIGKARAHLYKAYTLHPEFPEASSRMIMVAMAGGVPEGESTRLWFERAREAQFDNAEAYDNYLLSSRVRWGGSNDKLLAFGVECGETKRFDTAVPLVYFKSVRAAAEDSKTPTRVWAASFEPLQEVLIGYLALGDAANVHRSLTRMVLLSYLAGRPAEARAALDQIGGPENLAADIVNDFRFNQEALGARIYAATSPGAPKLAAGIAALKDGHWDDAVSDAAAAVALSANEPPKALQAMKHRGAMIMQSADFGRGMPVAPRFEPGLPGWVAYAGQWSALSTTGVEVKDKGCLATGDRFGREYEVSAEISCTPDPVPTNPAGAGFRIDPRGHGQPCDILVVQDGDLRRLVITGINSRDVVLTTRAAVNSLTVQVWNDTCVVRVNGQVMFKGILTFEANRDTDGDMIALSSLGPAKFTNVRIRKMAAPPQGASIAHKGTAPVKGTVMSGNSGNAARGLSPFRRF